MSSGNDILVDIQRLERLSRRSLPLMAIALLCVFLSIGYSIFKLGKLQGELAGTNRTIQQKKEELASVESQRAKALVALNATQKQLDKQNLLLQKVSARLAQQKAPPVTLLEQVQQSNAATAVVNRNATAVVDQAQSQPTVPAGIESSPVSAIPVKGGVVKSGWAYLGDYDDTSHSWRTRYLDFPPDTPPASLSGGIQTVSRQTGALNVRRGMPTVLGTFPAVIDVLRPGSTLKIGPVRPWLSSGYQWAYVEYSSPRK